MSWGRKSLAAAVGSTSFWSGTGDPFVLEVKSCTLFGNSIAMFPDAVTVRGRRHIEELAALAVRGTAGGVVFLVHTPRVRYFLPDYHTDLTFARTFLNVKTSSW